MKILIAAAHHWNRELYEKWRRSTRHESRFVAGRDDLAPVAAAFSPDLICFIHWSWAISSAVYDSYECVGFHMTDLPFGRGGSPLQNLILRGHTDTMLSAFRVTRDMDAGPIYMKRPLSLAGRARDIYLRASLLAFDMIDEIADRRPLPAPQAGAVVEFKRRTPGESRVPHLPSAEALYDFIRMLDADGYPRAYLEHEGCRYELFDAVLEDGRLTARVEVSVRKGTAE